jgi:hypothetical protein
MICTEKKNSNPSNEPAQFNDHAFSLRQIQRAPFLGFKQTQNSSKGVLSAISQEKQTLNNKHRSSSTAESDFQSENSRFLQLAQDRLGREPTVKKVPGDCGDKEDLPCFIWTMGGAISYPTVLEHQFPVHPHCLVMCASFFLRSHKNFLVMCASFLGV